MNDQYLNLVKSATLYSQQAAQVVDAAHSAIQETQKQREKAAAIAPTTLQALTSLNRTNDQPFVPQGYEKQAEACLQSHGDTLKLLNHVLVEYAKLKEANDSQMPVMGRAAGKTAAAQRTVVFDSAESNAMRRYVDLLTS